jgi:hypothetical protein
MGKDLLPLFVGFVLTSVLGGALGYLSRTGPGRTNRRPSSASKTASRR